MANRLQILYNHFEREFALFEERFLAADKHRLEAKAALSEILSGLMAAREELTQYPQATVLKRMGLIETLLKDLDLRFTTERRNFNALGFLLSRLRENLASEMLEPKLYNKIRSALEKEASLQTLREKYPDSDAVVTAPKMHPAKPAKSVRLMLIGAANLHYAIPVGRILKKTEAAGAIAGKLRETGFTPLDLPTGSKPSDQYVHAVAYRDTKDRRRMVYCDEYFKPVEIPQRLLRENVAYALSGTAENRVHRPYVRFYGRQFFVYGARLSYTVRPGGRANSPER